jgi:hypothetical protein
MEKDANEMFNRMLIIRDVRVHHAPRVTLLAYSKISFSVIGQSRLHFEV